MKRLGWSKRQGREYLIKRYGKRSRLHLSDEELIEFWNYLKEQGAKVKPKVNHGGPKKLYPTGGTKFQ